MASRRWDDMEPGQSYRRGPAPGRGGAAPGRGGSASGRGGGGGRGPDPRLDPREEDRSDWADEAPDDDTGPWRDDPRMWRDDPRAARDARRDPRDAGRDPRPEPGRDPRRDSQPGPRDGRRSPREERVSWSPGRVLAVWGTFPGRLGVAVVALSAAIGMLTTVVVNAQPGLIIGGFLVAGTLAAGFGVEVRDVRLIIPVPALAYVVAALVAGVAEGSAAGSSLTALAISALQWIAAGFLPMVTATLLAVTMTLARPALARRWRRPGASAPVTRPRSRSPYR